MIPVPIRLNGIVDGSEPAAQFVWGKICDTLKANGYAYAYYDPNDIYEPDFGDKMVFRKLFSAGHFPDSDGTSVIPLIIFDQFEEVLYNAPVSARLLISQLYSLIDDNYDLSLAHATWHEDTDFRIVISIREDDLFLFEDYIDTLNCTDFKSNRYRLLPLTYKEARSVILNPCKDLFEHDNEMEIVDKIIELACDSGQHVNSLMLSLICHEIFNKYIAKNGAVSLDDLNNFSDIIETYYLDAIHDAKIKKNERYYLEDNLVDEKGRRKQIYLSDFQKKAPKAQILTTNNGRRLLNINQDKVEFIHDQLAKAIANIKRTRKSKNYRHIGIVTLIVTLLALFLYSFSILPTPDLNKSETIRNEDAVNNIYVEKIIYDSIDLQKKSYKIYDCPNLKSVNIKDILGEIYIYNCQNLVNIDCPDGFTSDIIIYNCDNVRNIDNPRIIRSYIPPADSCFKSQITHTQSAIIKDYCQYDSIRHIILLKKFPIYKSFSKAEGLSKVVTNLPDSIKAITDCFVPYGYKDEIRALVEFQPFKSIQELPVYYNWQTNWNSIFGYFHANPLMRYLSVLGIIVVQLFFWITSYFYYKSRNYGKLTSIIRAFFYGIGISFIVTLSFMAFYWFTYNLLLPTRQVISTCIGLTAAVVCLIFIYKDAFYSITIYLKSTGLYGFLHDLKSLPFKLWVAIKKRISITLSFLLLLLIAILFISVKIYNNGLEKREEYFHEIRKLSEYQQYGKIMALVDRLEAQHGSFIYPSFATRLQRIRDQILDSIETDVFHETTIDTDLIKYKLNATDSCYKNVDVRSLKFMDISTDANRIIFDADLYNRDTEKYFYQSFVYDVNEQRVDSIAPKSKDSSNAASLSPSGKYILSSGNYERYLYDSELRSVKRIEDGLDRGAKSLYIPNDSIYFFTDRGRLYCGNFRDNPVSVLIDGKEDIRNQLTPIGTQFIAGQGYNDELIIYDLSNYRPYFHSKHHNIGDIRYVDLDKVITSEMIIEIPSDSIISEREGLLYLNGETVINDKTNHKITTLDGDLRLTLPFSYYIAKITDDYIVVRNSSAIDIYTYGCPGIHTGRYPISEYDRKVFGLK